MWPQTAVLFFLAIIHALSDDYVVASTESPCKFKEGNRKYGDDLMSIMRPRFSLEEGQFDSARIKYEVNHSWAQRDLCSVTSNVISIVEGLFPVDTYRRHIVSNETLAKSTE